MDYKFYTENENDKISPVVDDIRQLPVNARIEIFSHIKHLADNNGALDGFNFKVLTGYPFKQIRVRVSKDLFRVLVHIVVNDKIIILHIFSKREGMKPKEHKKLVAKEYKEAQRRYDKLIKSNNTLTT